MEKFNISKRKLLAGMTYVCEKFTQGNPGYVIFRPSSNGTTLKSSFINAVSNFEFTGNCCTGEDQYYAFVSEEDIFWLDEAIRLNKSISRPTYSKEPIFEIF